MDRIIKILKTLNRPGIDQVIEFMKENNYEGSRCYGHHKYKGGLVDHSLEVYDHMMKNRGDLPEDSIIVCAFFMTLARQQRADERLKTMKEDQSDSSINVVFHSQLKREMLFSPIIRLRDS